MDELCKGHAVCFTLGCKHHACQRLVRATLQCELAVWNMHALRIDCIKVVDGIASAEACTRVSSGNVKCFSIQHRDL